MAAIHVCSQREEKPYSTNDSIILGDDFFQINGKLLKLQRIVKSGFDIFGRWILKLNLWLQLLNFQQRHSC